MFLGSCYVSSKPAPSTCKMSSESQGLQSSQSSLFSCKSWRCMAVDTKTTLTTASTANDNTKLINRLCLFNWNKFCICTRSWSTPSKCRLTKRSKANSPLITLSSRNYWRSSFSSGINCTTTLLIPILQIKVSSFCLDAVIAVSQVGLKKNEFRGCSGLLVSSRN